MSNIFIISKKIENMGCLDVASVNEKIACIQNLESDAFEKQVASIAKDLKAFIYSNFHVDDFQRRLLERTSNETLKEYGEALSRAFVNRDTIFAEESSKKKCPEITIKIVIKF